jgi:hypothetical protein
MILDEQLAVRYALGRTKTWLYPKTYPMNLIIESANLVEKEFSKKTLEKLKELKIKINRDQKKKQDQAYAYSVLLEEDIECLIRFLKNETVDFTGIENHLKEYSENVVIPKIKEYLELEYEPPTINFVKELPGLQWTDRKGGGFGADKWQSKRYGMPEGIFIHEASLIKNSELILIHELTHPAVEAFPNFVPWFDEGLCNLMAYWIFFETIGDLSFRREMKTRLEFADYYFNPARLFRRPDNMFFSLLLIGGMDLVKLLIKYKRDSPEKVNWNIIPQLLQEGADLETFTKKAINEPVKINEPELPPILRRITSTVLAHDISHVLSPLALILYRRILERKPHPGKWMPEELSNTNITDIGVKEAVKELKDRSLVWVFPDRSIEPYTGPIIGTSHFLEAGLMRAWSRKYQNSEW